MEEELLVLFGVSMQQLIFVSGAVYLLTQQIKVRLSDVVTITGWRASALAALIAAGLSWKLNPGNWEQVVALAAATWLLPAGFHKARKNGGTK